MTTIFNNPVPSSDEGGGGSGFLVGVLLLIVFVGVLLYFGIPVIKNMGPIQVKIPDTQVVLPDKVDVNITPAK